MKKAVKKTKKVAKQTNMYGLAGYVGLSAVLFVNVYFFLVSALKSIVYMDDAVLISVSVLMTTFVSFGAFLFLTRSTLHKGIKIAGIVCLAASFLYLNVLLNTRVF